MLVENSLAAAAAAAAAAAVVAVAAVAAGIDSGAIYLFRPTCLLAWVPRPLSPPSTVDEEEAQQQSASNSDAPNGPIPLHHPEELRKRLGVHYTGVVVDTEAAAAAAHVPSAVEIAAVAHAASAADSAAAPALSCPASPLA